MQDLQNVTARELDELDACEWEDDARREPVDAARAERDFNDYWPERPRG